LRLRSKSRSDDNQNWIGAEPICGLNPGAGNADRQCLVSDLALLALVHFYWDWTRKAAKTSCTPGGKQACATGNPATVSVARLLLAYGRALSFVRASVLGFIRTRICYCGVWLICVIFEKRAIRDFRLVGSFNAAATATASARWNTRLCSPPGLLIGVPAGFLSPSCPP